jgi:branched-chain amino acid transport system substrate-binding protein
VGLALRAAFPDRISYIRVASTDDNQPLAAARFALRILGAKRALVLDDTSDLGRAAADSFATQFVAEGGVVAGRMGIDPTTGNYARALPAHSSNEPDLVYFGGTTASGGGQIRWRMGKIGMGEIPFIGGDGVFDTNGPGSFLRVTGAAAAWSYSTVPTIGEFPQESAFDARYRARFGSDPGLYSAAAYACAQVLVDALRHVAARDPAAIREQVRAYATDPGHEFETVIGAQRFDANGDTTRVAISVFEADPTASGGAGEWVFDTQIEFTAK